MKHVFRILVMVGLSHVNIYALDVVKQRLTEIDTILSRSESLRNTDDAEALLEKLKDFRSLPFITAECVEKVLIPAEQNCRNFIKLMEKKAEAQSNDKVESSSDSCVENSSASTHCFSRENTCSINQSVPSIHLVVNTLQPATIVDNSVEQMKREQDHRDMLNRIEQLEASVKNEKQKFNELSKSVKRFYAGSRELFAHILERNEAKTCHQYFNPLDPNLDCDSSNTLVCLGCRAVKRHQNEDTTVEPAHKKYKKSLNMALAALSTDGASPKRDLCIADGDNSETALVVSSERCLQRVKSPRIEEITDTPQDKLSQAIVLYK